MLKKFFLGISFILILTASFWYIFIALKEKPMLQEDIISAYQYEKVQQLNFVLTKISPRTFHFTFNSFDGDIVKGQISYPEEKSDNYPVMVGVSAMGRGYARWWTDSFKGRPTVTQVNKITDLVTQKGYVVIAIDARFHSTRKDPQHSLRSIMNDLYFFGDKEPYQAMIHDTIIDYRVLLDWIEKQPDLNSNKIIVVGYSMGGQISLLLGALDERVTEVISIVPPFIDDKIALVAPKNVISLLDQKPVLMITASDDENATNSENEYLYQLIPSANKNRIDFDSGHILPEGYVEALNDSF